MLVHEILAIEIGIERIFEVFSSPVQAWDFQAFLASSWAKTLQGSQTFKLVIITH